MRAALLGVFLIFNANKMNIMTPISNTSLNSALEDIIKSRPNSIQAAVAREALDYHCPKDFFSDLLQHGCVSGMVSSLVYYADTHAFFDQYYSAIEALRDDVEHNLGEPLQIKGDLKNFMAWFAFEETVYRLVLEFGLEV